MKMFDLKPSRLEPAARVFAPIGRGYQKYWHIGLLLGLIAVSAWVGFKFFRATEPYGIGVRSDSVAYFMSAHNFAHGIGMGRMTGDGNFKPMTHWPPLYPLVLSLFEFGGVPALTGARWLGVLLMAAVVFLTGLCLARMTHSLWFALAGALILAISPALWETSLYAMTEPLYLVLCLLAYLLLDQYLEKGRWPWLVACGLALGGCFLTRYVGFTLAGAFAIILLFQRRWTLMERLKRSLALGAISLAPIGLWMVRNWLQGGTATNRSLQYFPISPNDYQLAWQTWSAWFEPNQAIFQVGLGKIAVIVLILLLFMGFRWVNKPSEALITQTWMPAVSIIYVALYSAGVIGSRMFMDPLITFFEQRILFLIYIPLMLIVIYALHWLFEKGCRRSVYLGAGMLILSILIAYSYILVYQVKYQPFLQNSHDFGLGYSDKSLKTSCLMPAIKAIPPHYLIYTDNIERLYFFTQADADQINDDQLVAQLAETKAGSGFVFVLFDSKSHVPDLVKSHFQNAQTVCSAPVIDVVAPAGS